MEQPPHQSQQSQQQQQQYKANKDLTEEERKAKRELKQDFLKQRKRQKLETRLRHARMRNDDVVEQETQQHLHQLAEEENMQPVVQNRHDNESARIFILQMAQALQKTNKTTTTTNNNNNNSSNLKQVQIQQARHLLQHMTKGTQQKSMFENNPNALWGYTRHKFIERALLTSTSLCHVQQSSSSNNNNNDNYMWQCLLQLKTICSIGCGPGNDALGVVAFLKQNTNKVLEHILCLDYVVKEWNMILMPLKELLLEGKNVTSMTLGACDVTKALSDESNIQIKQHLEGVNLFLVSYLLTETRGKWEGFLRELIQLAQPGTLFYLAEPTPWQLHQVIKMTDELHFVWLDSSMNQPNIQVLEKRLGPAVLLAQKKAISESP